MAEAKNAVPPRITAPAPNMASELKRESIMDSAPTPPVEPTPPVPPRIEQPQQPPAPERAQGPAGAFGENVNELPGNLLTPKAKRMRDILVADERVPYIIPLASGESQPAVHIITMNGFSLGIKKGVSVTLPRRVVQFLMDNIQATSEALSADNIPNRQGGYGLRTDRDRSSQHALY